MRLHELKTALLASSLLLCGSATAQTYDPDTTSPLTLLQAPPDGVSYFETLERARAAHAAQNWAAAEPLLEQLTRLYDRDPHVWMMLGDAREGLTQYDEAIEAYRRAGPLIGWDLEYANAYNVAIMQNLAGDRAAALATLRQHIENEHGFYRGRLYDWSYFENLREDREFLDLIGRVDVTGWTREQGWAHDIEWLYNEVKRVNPDYRNQPFPEEFERRYRDLRANAPNLSDEEIFFGMQRMLAVLHQGHLILWADHNARTPNRYLPVRFYAFPDGVYIMGADEAHQNLIGSRVLSIGSLTAEEAFRRKSAAESVDGDMAHIWGVSRLAETYYLRGMGAIEDTGEVRLVLQRPGGRRQTVSLATLDQSMPGRQDRMVAPAGVEPPLFVRELDQRHWTQALPEHDALYVQVNNISPDEDETLQQFGIRLWSDLQQSRPRNLILDIRHNNGGNTQTYPDLLRTLVAYSRMDGAQIYVLMGRRTYSAAGNFVTDLERLTDPIFVGEASSECCNLYGDPIAVYLPYSRVQGELTAVRWQLSSPGDRRREISPEVPVQLTARDYFAGRDTVMDATLRLIERRRGR